MKEIGEKLKEAREEHSVSLEEASIDLELKISQLESIEAGNSRSFRDLYELKTIITDYAKYLGLNVEGLVNEYNDFLFEKTSKISLDDIKAARVKEEEEKPNIRSPYTKDFSRIIDFTTLAPYVLICLILIFIFLIIFILVKSVNTRDIVTTELYIRKEFNYEFTY